MNKYKLFVSLNLLWHLCILFIMPVVGNIFAFIPVLIYTAILTFLIRFEDTKLKVFIKGLILFAAIAALTTDISPFMGVGILFCTIAVIISLTAQPFLVRFCKT